MVLTTSRVRCHSPPPRPVFISMPISPSISLAASQTLTQIVTAFIAREESALATSYKWPLTHHQLHQHLPITVAGANSFHENLDLKQKMTGLWATNPSYQHAIADYYVRVWGGIRGNKLGTLSANAATIASGGTPNFHGIASWSKIATAADATSAAIFDARVAVSLNALQVLALREDQKGVLFPKLESQNKVIKRVGAQLIAAGKARGWEVLPKDKLFFSAYIELLKRATKSLSGSLPLARGEMVLFAMAENLASQAEARLIAGRP